MKFYHNKLEKVKLGVGFRRSSANTQRFTNRPHELINNLLGCKYGFGRHFLIGLFETVGEAAISSALREVYLRILAVRQHGLVSRHLDTLHEVADEGLALRERSLLQELPEVRHVPLDLLRAG